jgi:ABC-type cobalamin/Fe3+-siderophores transport system ATPase subunit
MRKAEIDRAWERCRESEQRGLHVRKVVFRQNNGGKAILTELTVGSRICALLGENGARKTALMSSMNSALHPDAMPPWRIVIHAIELSYRSKDLAVLRSGLPEEGVEPSVPRVYYFDAAVAVQELKKRLLAQSNLDELVGQADTKQLTGDEFDAFRYVLGRDYSSIALREIELADTVQGGETPFPFFSVSYANGSSYDSRWMGFGELSAFWLIWALQGVERNSIVLVDEPDSHLSAVSRSALSDYLAWVASEKQLWILFSSHSLEPVQKLRESEMLVLSRPEHGVTAAIAASGHKRGTMLKLGFAVSRKFLFVVEDVDALEVLASVMRKWMSDLAPCCDIRKKLGGADAIKHLATYFPEDTPVCELTVVLDGDKRYDNAPSRMLFLPGESDPMDQVRAWCMGHMDAAAEALDVQLSQMTPALVAVAAVDSHDFCMALSERLAIPELTTARVRQLLIKEWLKDEETGHLFEPLVAQLRARIEESAFAT